MAVFPNGVPGQIAKVGVRCHASVAGSGKAKAGLMKRSRHCLFHLHLQKQTCSKTAASCRAARLVFFLQLQQGADFSRRLGNGPSQLAKIQVLVRLGQRIEIQRQILVGRVRNHAHRRAGDAALRGRRPGWPPIPSPPRRRRFPRAIFSFRPRSWQCGRRRKTSPVSRRQPTISRPDCRRRREESLNPYQIESRYRLLTISKSTSPGFKSGFNPPAKPQVRTKSGGASVLASRAWPDEASLERLAGTLAPPARNSRDGFFRVLPPDAGEENGNASFARRHFPKRQRLLPLSAKQTSVTASGFWLLASGFCIYFIPASLSFQIR